LRTPELLYEPGHEGGMKTIEVKLGKIGIYIDMQGGTSLFHGRPVSGIIGWQYHGLNGQSSVFQLEMHFGISIYSMHDKLSPLHAEPR